MNFTFSKKMAVFQGFQTRPMCLVQHAARRVSHAAAPLSIGALVGLLLADSGMPVSIAMGQASSATSSTTAQGRLAHPEVPPAAALSARSSDGNSTELPLLTEAISVQIDTGHATASYDHVFQNEAGSRLEGNYRLLVGEGATATGFAYWNGEQKIVGEVFEREAARDVYQAMTGLNRDPGLLEQSGEGGFSFHVFPIEPGEKKRIAVQTSRWLPRREGTVEYRARLSRPDAKVTIAIRDERGVRAITSASHDIVTACAKPTECSVTVAKSKTGDDEFLLRYEPADSPLALSVRVHHDAGQRGFFCATITAPPRLPNTKREPKDVTLVLDRSGSMQGASIESARTAAKAVIERLVPEDRVNVIAFDDKVESLWNEPRQLTDDARHQAIDYVGDLRTRGGTDIAKALATALASQKKDKQSDIVIFLTDGQSDGPSAIRTATDDTSDTRVFTVGLGDGVDKALLSRVASLKHGRFTFIADSRGVQAEFAKLLAQFEEPSLTALSIKGEEARIEETFPAALPDIFPGDEMRIFGRINGQVPAKLVIEADDHGTKRRFETAIHPEVANTAPEVARSWARSRVDDLLEEIRAQGETDELKNEAIELGLAYALVTPFTSFLAIPESEMTEQAKAAVGSMRETRKRILMANKDAAQISRLNMPPGDPILRVHAPKNAERVTATFPFGLVSELFWDDFTECWMTRFLVPKDVADGVYKVPVVIVLADGTVTTARAEYTIDSKEAEVEVDTRPAKGGVEIRVLADEAATEVRVALVSDTRQMATLLAEPNRRSFRGTLRLPTGKHELRVVVADLARNETERLVTVEVAP